MLSFRGMLTFRGKAKSAKLKAQSKCRLLRTYFSTLHFELMNLSSSESSICVPFQGSTRSLLPGMAWPRLRRTLFAGLCRPCTTPSRVAGSHPADIWGGLLIVVSQILRTWWAAQRVARARASDPWLVAREEGPPGISKNSGKGH